MTLDETLATLEDLIAVCRDGELGFEACARRADSPTLRASLERRAAACRDSLRELKAEATRLGVNLAIDGSAVGRLHRGWVVARSLLSMDDDVAMLEECERGESVARSRYRQALHRPLPEATRAIVERQLLGVERNHADMRALLERARDLA